MNVKRRMQRNYELSSHEIYKNSRVTIGRSNRKLFHRRNHLVYLAFPCITFTCSIVGTWLQGSKLCPIPSLLHPYVYLPDTKSWCSSFVMHQLTCSENENSHLFRINYVILLTYKKRWKTVTILNLLQLHLMTIIMAISPLITKFHWFVSDFTRSVLPTAPCRIDVKFIEVDISSNFRILYVCICNVTIKTTGISYVMPN